MRAVVQRVTEASVTVDNELVGSIGVGLLVLVGVSREDQAADAAALADKLVGLRVFGDEAGHMNRSLLDVDGGVLLVSQFTLLGDLRRGRRPSFTDAAPPEVAAPLLEEVARRISEHGVPVRSGRFGAYMSVQLVNDGPVTVVIDVAEGKVR